MKYDKPDHSLIKYILALLNIPSNADASCQQAAAALGHQRPYYIQMACSLIRFMDEMPGGFLIYQADDDAEYEQTYTIDLSQLKPTVSFPHLPENTKTIDEVGEIAIDQVVIGSCTNGRMDDMRAAAQVMKGRKVAKGVRCIVIPATQAIYLQSMREGLLETFIEAGAVVSTPTCGPCLGGYMGILAAGERCISTTNRNFVGRMGHVDSEVYLASPAVAAASAVLGRIACPCEL